MFNYFPCFHCRPLQVLPKSITIFTDALVSLERIESLIFEAEKYDKNLFSLNKFEREKNIESNNIRNKMDKDGDSDDNDDDNVIQQSESPKSKNNNELYNKYQNYNRKNNKNTEIILNSVTAVRSKNVIILKNISFSLESSGLILIVGGNACGKTSLLLSIINELQFTVGEASINPNEVNMELSQQYFIIIKNDFYFYYLFFFFFLLTFLSLILWSFKYYVTFYLLDRCGLQCS